MNALPLNPILEFNPNQLAEVRKEFNYDNPNRLRQDLNLFQDWIKMQRHFLVKEYDIEYLERCLINSKGSIERAKKLLDKICTLRGLMPEYLQGFDIENEFKTQLELFPVCVLPKTTPKNHRVLFYFINNPDAAIFDHFTTNKYFLMILHYLIRYDYNSGIELVCDTGKMSLGIITKLNPVIIKNTVTIMTEALGLRIKGIHLISGSKFLDTILTIIKQGLSKKVSSRLYVHEDYESLYKVIPKDLFPKDFGGDLDSSSKILDKNYKEFCSPEFIKYMKFIESAATNESERLCAHFNEEYSGMPGSFKVLTVD